MEKMNIYIPSYQRWQPSRAHTLKKFQTLQSRLVYIIVRNTERERYKKLLRDLNSPAKMVIVNKSGVSEARNRCLKHAIKSGDKKMMIIDDDLEFFIRKSADNKLKKVRAVEKMCTRVDNRLDRYAHVSISNRFGNYFQEKNEVEGQRGVRCVAYRLDILQKHKLWFEFYAREGMHMTLRLFERGYPNLLIYKYAQESVEKNVCDKDGRTMLKWTTDSAKMLEKAHPDVVKYVHRDYKSGPRGEVRVSWRKALKKPLIYLD